ncbi:MAG TPA: Gfo/Idh/MocA family oxidoreductase [Verrucomicrobiae bacterium]|nr:Gfo/Idh/MocA family oxidoreductase [Verrucomicrobiae bacterium]
MNKLTRRSFLETSGKTAAGMALAGTTLSAARAQQVAGANERPNVALIGCGGRGRFVIRVMIEEGGANCAALCDLSDDRLEKCWQFISEPQKTKPRLEKDYRKILDAKDIDAIVIATPDIWHAPLAIMACQAGKDVYVEKPHSHNIWESGKMVEAARKYNKIVQVGTQNRSKEYNLAAREIVRSGKLGKIGLVKVFNLKSGNAFKLGDPGTQPPGFDWDRWLGRAPVRPYHQQIFSGGWHNYWDFCGGDTCDDGIHQIDLALMLMGDPGFPTNVRSIGGRYAHRGDDSEVPDVQISNWDFGSFVMTFELSGYPKYMEKSSDALRRKTLVPDWTQNSTRIELYGSELLMIVGRHGGGFVVEQSKSRIVEKMLGEAGDAEHYKNFLECIKGRKKPNADISIAHASNVIAHMSNIAHRVGNVALKYDAEKVCFDNERANKFIKPEYRKGYEIPENV